MSTAIIIGILRWRRLLLTCEKCTADRCFTGRAVVANVFRTSKHQRKTIMQLPRIEAYHAWKFLKRSIFSCKLITSAIMNRRRHFWSDCIHWNDCPSAGPTAYTSRKLGENNWELRGKAKVSVSGSVALNRSTSTSTSIGSTSKISAIHYHTDDVKLRHAPLRLALQQQKTSRQWRTATETVMKGHTHGHRAGGSSSHRRWRRGSATTRLPTTSSRGLC